MPPKRGAKYNLPVPLQEGIILKDTEKREWRLGPLIAQGGFGLIYLASPHLDIPVDDRAVHVIKVEYLENGPLFSELKFYQRAAKQEQRIPAFWGSGQAEHNGKSYRFMVMERLGEDLQTIFERKGRRFGKGTVLQVGLQMFALSVKLYHLLHLLMKQVLTESLAEETFHGVYLADYGLAYRYCPNGNHKEYRENPKKGHNGTIEFTSLDAHKGAAPSRRGDLEILGYCMMQWMCGTLPWEGGTKDPDAVQAAKEELLDELPDSVTRRAPPGSDCGQIAAFLKYAYNLAYNEKPNYEILKKILLSGLEHNGVLDLTATESIPNKHAAKYWKQAGSAKPGPQRDEGAKEHGEAACRRKATVGIGSSHGQGKQVPAGLNKSRWIEVEKREPPHRTYFHNTFQKIGEKSIENGITSSPICQPEPFQALTSSFVCGTSQFHQELYQYILAIAVLFLLILLSLYFL